MPSAKEKAEIQNIHKKWPHEGDCNSYEKALFALIATTRREALAETTDILKGLMDEKRKCSPHYTDHDDRWCEVCESMEDAYGYALTKLEALAASDERTMR